MVGVRQGTAALVALCVSLACVSSAAASGEPGFTCKRVHHGTAQVNPSPGDRPPLVIGDSTVLLPIPNLTAGGYSANARGCRGFAEAVRVASPLPRKHRL